VTSSNTSGRTIASRVFCRSLVAAAALLLGWINPAAAQTIGGTVDLTANSPLFARPGSNCSVGSRSVKYTTVEFYVETAGSYTFQTTGNEETSGHVDDPFLVIYTSPFDPTMQQTRCLGANDDSSSLESLLTLTLSANVIYTAIVTTYSNGATGLITWSAAGAGAMHYVISVQSAVTSAPTIDGGTLTVQLSNPDTAYWVAVASGGTEPTALQIIAGHGANDAAAAGSGNFAVATAVTDTPTTITGLTSATAYDVYVVAGNGGGGSGVRQASLMTIAPPPASLVSSTPTDGATNVAPGSTIILTFDQTVTLGTGNIVIFNDTDSNSQTIDVANPLDALALAGSVLTITPATALAVGKAYHLAIAATAVVGTSGPFPGILDSTTLNFQTVPSDTTPDEFAFPAQTGAAPSSDHTSEPITVSGINQPAAISVSGGKYAVNAGAATSEPGTVVEGDVVTVEQTASALLSTTTTATLTIGGFAADFGVTTGDNNPLVLSMSFNGTEGPCTAGGVRILSGVDYDGSGVLSGAEIKQTNYVCNGLSGGNGENGSNGSSGTGNNGVGSLIDTSVLDPDPAACPAGGIALRSGPDTNHNGTLDDAEVSAQRMICNGLNELARSSLIAVQSSACPSGGVLIEHGIDVNGNGGLDDDEVTSSDTLCNGASFAVRTVSLDPGSAECPAGGRKIETGLDEDGDLSLEDGEVKTSETLCDAISVLFNTVTLSSDPKVCPHGGLRVEIGRDDGDPSGTAADSVLQAGEVDSTHDVCLAATDVLIGGGGSSCSVRTIGSSGVGHWGWALAGLLVLRSRRRRQLPTS
jgi:MYXO-CTERM domain-containing protein